MVSGCQGGMYGLVEGLIKLNQEKDVKINTSSKIKKIIVEKINNRSNSRGWE